MCRRVDNDASDSGTTFTITSSASGANCFADQRAAASELALKSIPTTIRLNCMSAPGPATTAVEGWTSFDYSRVASCMPAITRELRAFPTSTPIAQSYFDDQQQSRCFSALPVRSDQ